MSGLFIDQEVRCPESEFVPIVSPIDPHPTRGDWVNEGVEAYKAAFGDAEYENNYRRDMPYPMPENSFSQRFWQWRKVLGAKLEFGIKALYTGHRATHMQGVGAKGTITVTDNPEFPEHEFFTPGREFKCRLRHANASFYDDASLQVRACSLKFADCDFESPLDILMNTGVIQAFWNFESFMAFVKGRIGCTERRWEAQKEWLLRWPGCYVGIIESVRCAPTSYADMLYHTCIIYPFRGRDGQQRWAKYRLVPCGLSKESGFLTPEQQKHPWIQCRESDCDLPRKYLPEEYQNRLLKGPVEYMLQIQIREFDLEKDTWQFFNSARVWNLETSPWVDLAKVRIEAALPDEVTERMAFWLGHQPPSLGLTSCFSPLDYRSMAGARYRVYPVSRRLRSIFRTLHFQRRWPTDF